MAPAASKYSRVFGGSFRALTVAKGELRTQVVQGLPQAYHDHPTNPQLLMDTLKTTTVRHLQAYSWQGSGISWRLLKTLGEGEKEKGGSSGTLCFPGAGTGQGLRGEPTAASKRSRLMNGHSLKRGERKVRSPPCPGTDPMC